MFKKLAFVLFLSLFSSIAFSADKLNINTATLEQLESLNGIGAKTAMAIIEYRESVGSFSDVKQLIDVKGIGEKKLSSLEEVVAAEPIEEAPIEEAPM